LELIVKLLANNVLVISGACLRFVFGYGWRSITGRKKFSFKAYLNGEKNEANGFEKGSARFANIMVGGVFWLMLLIAFVVLMLP